MSDQGTQTYVPTDSPEEGVTGPGAGRNANVDAHMPAQPGSAARAENDPVWATPVWNPATNEWAPSNEQHSVWGVAEPSHGDTMVADPMSESYGQDPSGTIPDARLNLIDSVRHAMTPLPAPPQEHHHVVETYEPESQAVRFHQETVTGITPTTILTQNRNRKRALLRILALSGASTQIQNVATNTTGFTATVPAGQTWTNISSVFWQLVTDATVGNRTLQIIVRDASNRTLAQYVFTTAQAASLTRQYQSVSGVTTDTLAGTQVSYPDIFAGLVLTAGYSIQVVNTGTIGVGDAYSPVITATIAGTGSVTLVPIRDGGNATATNIGWALTPGDIIEIKSQAGIEAVGVVGASATVFVYEELQTLSGIPGVST